MQDLVEHMGVHKRSMYDTFGDKHSLLLHALDRYIATVKSETSARTEAAASSREALRAVLQLAVVDADNPPGCFAVNCATEAALADDEVARRVADEFAAENQRFLDLIREGQDAGEISRERDAGTLATAFHNGAIGLRVQARTRLSPERLEAMIDELMTLLD
jgi:TetR/AcrR family transcriptional repressor of nem operon